MSDDLIQRLRSRARQLDHSRDGMGYHSKADVIMHREAADTLASKDAAIAEIRAELERVKPRFKQGDRVLARMHQGPLADGLLCRVETNYGPRDNEPYHVYSVLFDGHDRQQHLGDRQVLSLASRALSQDGEERS